MEKYAITLPQML